MEPIFYTALLLVAIFCAYRAMVAKRILSASLYLASISACVSAVLYLLGAQEVAVIELSVGAGLVTVLLVYALSVVGEDALDPSSVIPKSFGYIIAAGVAIVLIWMLYPVSGMSSSIAPKLAAILWEQRVLDVWVQIVLIFSGVLGILGLLSETPETKPDHVQGSSRN